MKRIKDDKKLFGLYDQVTEYDYPAEVTTKERISGAIMGVLIGDALGLGCHWYYEYPQLWEAYGTWVDNYVDPKETDENNNMGMISAYRYAAGVRGGMCSQTGQLIQVVLETVAANSKKNGTGEFVKAEYIEAIDNYFKNKLLPQAVFESDIDVSKAHDAFQPSSGTFMNECDGIKCFSGRYTDEVVRFNFDYWYNNGKMDGKWWADENPHSVCSTSDGAQMGVILAALYRDPEELFHKAYELVSMWYKDPAFITHAVIYIMSVHAFINNVPLNKYEKYLMWAVDLTGEIAGQQNKAGKINSFDDVVSPLKSLSVLKRAELSHFPDDRFVSHMFGLDCHLFHLLPATYYYAFKYAYDFETGILMPVNGGGNNMARAALTGGLLGAMGGIRAIPQRFIEGLKDDKEADLHGFDSQGEYLLNLAETIANGSKGEKPDLATVWND
jgi:ADP-ribosyl-[dinitrogen reductase] hydrolase